MSDHRLIDIISRLAIVVLVLVLFLIFHLIFIRDMDFLGRYEEDVLLREQDLSLITPTIDSINEAKQNP